MLVFVVISKLQLCDIFNVHAVVSDTLVHHHVSFRHEVIFSSYSTVPFFARFVFCLAFCIIHNLILHSLSFIIACICCTIALLYCV